MARQLKSYFSIYKPFLIDLMDFSSLFSRFLFFYSFARSFVSSCDEEQHWQWQQKNERFNSKLFHSTVIQKKNPINGNFSTKKDSIKWITMCKGVRISKGDFLTKKNTFSIYFKRDRKKSKFFIITTRIYSSLFLFVILYCLFIQSNAWLLKIYCPIVHE